MTRLWPQLKVLSSVVSGAFAVSVPRLRALAGPGPALYTTCFGATEGMVGINLWGDAPERYALALGAVHFEFLPVSELDAASPRAVGIGALEKGQCYEVVITNHAGLYRYRLGDVVRIVDFAGSTPVFEFDHRRGNVVDLVGEKTTEQHSAAPSRSWRGSSSVARRGLRTSRSGPRSARCPIATWLMRSWRPRRPYRVLRLWRRASTHCSRLRIRPMPRWAAPTAGSIPWICASSGPGPSSSCSRSAGPGGRHQRQSGEGAQAAAQCGAARSVAAWSARRAGPHLS